MSEKKYKVGMYGGKFLPMHKGHFKCLETAARECEKVYLILFYGGTQEMEIINQRLHDKDLNLANRVSQVRRAAKQFDNVKPCFIDVSECRFADGSEDWDAETPLVNEVCGHLDAVYGSEPSYAPYFARAYPDAVYRCLDPERKELNISATMVRNMNKDERKEWMV